MATAPATQRAASSKGVTAHFDREALACWELAAWIGQLSSDDYQTSFTSLLIALMHADNDLSRWFVRYLRGAGIHLDQIYAARNFRVATLSQIRTLQEQGEAPSGKPAVTQSAHHLVKTAHMLMEESGRSEVGVRHLLASYFVQLPEAHVRQMANWGFDAQREMSALIRQVQARDLEEVKFWVDTFLRHFSVTPDLEGSDYISPPAISNFAADTPEGKDLLDIDEDVYALSALICSRKVSPPLSIGLFGEWGAGKSFFIRRLQRAVSFISGQARASDRLQKDLPFYKNVIQIEFNAWNYSGGNLWAALVQHILENLRLGKDEDSNLVQKRLDHLKEQMQLERQVVDVAETRKEGARKQALELTNQLEQLRTEHEKKVDELKDVLATDVLKTVTLDEATVNNLNEIRARLGLSEASAAAGEFMAAVGEARSSLGRVSALLRYVPEKQRLRFAVMSVMVFVVPVLISILCAWLLGKGTPYLASASAVVGWISTTLGLAATWLKQRTRALDEPLRKLEQLQAHARQRVEAEQKEYNARAARLEKQINLAKDEILAAEAKKQEATLRLRQIEAQIASTSPASVLADFISERSQSEDYRRYLGLPAVIRRDFESISDLVARENEALEKFEKLEDEMRNADRRINRIVLYIDDLDRCSEELVVEVLKAVHLLLAFPLFVVVVAVDARWLSRSLTDRYPGLVANGGQVHSHREHATPHDYLEKIFQIPFWLRTPQDNAVKQMIQGLAGVRKLEPGEPERDASGGLTPSLGGDGAASEEADLAFDQKLFNPNADLLAIEEDELTFMQRMAPLLQCSPRALKRYVNVYRLLKASLSPEERIGFFDDSDGTGSPSEKVLFWLALANGVPELAETLFKEHTTTVSLSSILARMEMETALVSEPAGRLSKWLAANRPGWAAATISAFGPWPSRVARYSYHLPRV